MEICVFTNKICCLKTKNFLISTIYKACLIEMRNTLIITCFSSHYNNLSHLTIIYFPGLAVKRFCTFLTFWFVNTCDFKTWVDVSKHLNTLAMGNLISIF